jgi:hypothetical protein
MVKNKIHLKILFSCLLLLDKLTNLAISCFLLMKLCITAGNTRKESTQNNNYNQWIRSDQTSAENKVRMSPSACIPLRKGTCVKIYHNFRNASIIIRSFYPNTVLGAKVRNILEFAKSISNLSKQSPFYPFSDWQLEIVWNVPWENILLLHHTPGHITVIETLLPENGGEGIPADSHDV